MLRQTFVAIENLSHCLLVEAILRQRLQNIDAPPIVIAPKETLGEPHPDGNVILLAECLSVVLQSPEEVKPLLARVSKRYFPQIVCSRKGTDNPQIADKNQPFLHLKENL
jgi:hypothetical protein